MHITFIKPKFWLIAECITLSLFVVSCKEQNLEPTEVVTNSSTILTSTPVPDNWLGKWSGPEGTFLQLDGGNGRYEVTIQNLDGPRIFKGNAEGNKLMFERDGVKESIRATNGAETGMKWLSEKSNCLTIRAGEGYCRD